ncbi:MAG: toxin TcdB middle/C-terminal domain-containing protein, partial [Byssovorax sp.]
KTWFHTGAWVAAARISAQYEHEYFQSAANLPDTIFEKRDLPLLPLTALGTREACRALKGQVLRQEIYAQDGTTREPLPYTVSERSYCVRQIQAPSGSSHGVFLSFPREAIEYHYERNASDPRVTHAFTLVVDDQGVTTRSVAVGYPRRPGLAACAEQEVGAITLTEIDVIHHIPEEAGWYRIGVPTETRSYELLGLLPLESALLTFEQVFGAASAAVEIPYEQRTGTSPYKKRLLSHARTLYARNDRTGPLALGVIESLALPWQSYAKAFTPALLTSALGTRATDAILIEGGYVRFLPNDDAWWVPSGRAAFSGWASFYLPTTFSDPFGNTSSIVYDTYNLAVLQATDPLGNTVLADYDYRLLAPTHVTDVNGNRAAAQVDELGRVVATAIMGKVGDTDGDTLADPTATFAYDLTRYATTGEPNVVHSRAREQHGAGNTRWQEAYSYSDGSGREVMRKIPAEPGLAPERDGDGALVHDGQGALVFAESDPRWVGTGRTVFDNKGNPVKQYEPFFSST